MTTTPRLPPAELLKRLRRRRRRPRWKRSLGRFYDDNRVLLTLFPPVLLGFLGLTTYWRWKDEQRLERMQKPD